MRDSVCQNNRAEIYKKDFEKYEEREREIEALDEKLDSVSVKNPSEAFGKEAPSETGVVPQLAE